MRTRSAISAAVLAVAVAACNDRPVPTAPSSGPSAAALLFEIRDGAHSGGNPNFFFLPPLQPSPRRNANFDRGGFNPNLAPAVEICDGRDLTPAGECAKALLKNGQPVVFKAVRGWDGLPDWVDAEQYHVLWQTRSYNLVLGRPYRILVKAGSALLGFLDIVPSNRLLSALRITAGGQDVGWLDDWVVPIRFRIERGALCTNPQECTEIRVNSKGGDFTLPSKYAALSVPAGAVKSGDTITVVVEKENPQYNGRCLPTDIVQSLGCYHFRSEPPLYHFATPVRMEACLDVAPVPPEQQDEVVLFKYNSTEGLHELPWADPLLIDCSTFSAMLNPADAQPSSFAAATLRRLGHWAGRLFGPQPLHASSFGGVPKGGGGLGGSFSDVGGAVPGTATQDTVRLSVPASATVGDTGLRATASGGSGSGAFSYASTTPAVCSVVDTTGRIAALAPGACSLTATKAADDVYRSATAYASFTVTARPGTAGSILIDASRDGGVWWSPQAGPFDPAAPHQGKALADSLRAWGYVVTELGRGVTITNELLGGFQIVVRAGYYAESSAAYSSAELQAYRNSLARGASLLFETDHEPRADSLASILGLGFTGSLAGRMSLIANPITAGTDTLYYAAGSYLTSVPAGATVLGTVSGQPVMGTLIYGNAPVFFIGDGNALEAVPRQLVINIFQWLATGTVTSFSCSGVTDISSTECAALVALYNATGGPNWKNHTGWLQTNTPCTTPWYGVNCPYGVFSELSLTDNNLTGTLPAALGDLHHLRFLLLSMNQLNGPIPATLGSLGSLEVLTANHNQLSGRIPAEFGSLDSLRILQLNSNLLSDSIPWTLGSLERLQVLALDHNQLSGTIPTTLGNLRSLQTLLLQVNVLIGQVPLAVAQLGGQLEQVTPGSCEIGLGNDVYLPDTTLYHNADLNGDGLICGVGFAPTLRTPVVQYLRTDSMPDVYGTLYRYHHFAITNAAAYAPELFAPSPNLPPCGLNTNSARTWMQIYSNPSGPFQQVYGYCGLSNLSGEFAFGVLPSATETGFQVELHDRLLNRYSYSAIVPVPR